mmetsp:Transcript_37407/g.123906  ORF Transcript_37407/g.123906 Transcript_37407/m.123906 type:complete len:256 (+) Transcript_37407:43-810(+)
MYRNAALNARTAAHGRVLPHPLHEEGVHAQRLVCPDELEEGDRAAAHVPPAHDARVPPVANRAPLLLGGHLLEHLCLDVLQVAREAGAEGEAELQPQQVRVNLRPAVLEVLVGEAAHQALLVRRQHLRLDAAQAAHEDRDGRHAARVVPVEQAALEHRLARAVGVGGAPEPSIVDLQVDVREDVQLGVRRQRVHRRGEVRGHLHVLTLEAVEVGCVGDLASKQAGGVLEHKLLERAEHLRVARDQRRPPRARVGG